MPYNILNGTLDDTLSDTDEEMELLALIAVKPTITQVELAEKTGRSLRTIKRKVAVLKEKGYIRRVNGRRNGRWEILR